MKNYCRGGIAAVAMAFFQLCHAAITPQKIQMAQKSVAGQVWEVDWTEFSVSQRNKLIKNVIDQEIESITQPSKKSQVAKVAITEKDQSALSAIDKIFEREKTNLSPDYEDAQDKALKLLTNITDAGKKEAQKAIDGYILNVIHEKFQETERPHFDPSHDYQWAKKQADDLLALMQTEDGKQKAQSTIDAYKNKHGIKE